MMRWGLLALAVVIAGCASRPPPRATPAPPAPPEKIPELVKAPDAVPRAEPRSALGNPPFYQVGGRRYMVLASADGYIERGVASWYGPDFHGGRTATGEPYDMYGMTAAHKTLPLPCYVRVTNLANRKSIVVRVNDRGPFVANRIIDLSYTAALKLDMVHSGTAFVQVETVSATGAAASVPPLLAATARPTATGAASVDVSTLPTPTLASAGAVDGPNPLGGAATAGAATSGAASGAAVAGAGTVAAALPAPSLFIQVGAYGNGDNARRAEQKLRAAGLDQVFTLPAAGVQPLLRVRIGPIANVAEYDALIARLAQLGFGNARLAAD